MSINFRLGKFRVFHISYCLAKVMPKFTENFGMTFAKNRAYGVPEFAGTEVNQHSGNLKGLMEYLQTFQKGFKRDHHHHIHNNKLKGSTASSAPHSPKQRAQRPHHHHILTTKSNTTTFRTKASSPQKHHLT